MVRVAPRSAFCLALAAWLVCMVVPPFGPFRNLHGLTLVLAAAVLVVLSLRRSERSFTEGHVQAVLLAWVGVELFRMAASGASIIIRLHGGIPQYAQGNVETSGWVLLFAWTVASFGAAVTLLRLTFGKLATWSGVWFGIAYVGLFAMASILLIELVYFPGIDVWHYQTLGAQRILDGGALYGAPMIIPEGADIPSFGLSWSENFPYMPLEAVLRAPFLAVLGDVRYASAAALAAAYPLGVALGKRLGLETVTSHLAASLFVLQGNSVWFIVNGWTEPLVVPFIVGGFWAWRSGRMRWAVVLLGAAAALKLWLLILIVGVAALEGFGIRRAFQMGGVWAATVLPFAIFHPLKVLDGILLFHLGEPPRTDSVAIVWIALELGITWPDWIGMALYGLGGLALGIHVLRRRNLRPETMLAFVALTLIALFLFGKQGHQNYYWLLPTLLLCGAMLGIGGQASGTSPAPTVVQPSGRE